jgi:hypothetical protein
MIGRTVGVAHVHDMHDSTSVGTRENIVSRTSRLTLFQGQLRPQMNAGVLYDDSPARAELGRDGTATVHHEDVCLHGRAAQSVNAVQSH